MDASLVDFRLATYDWYRSSELVKHLYGETLYRFDPAFDTRSYRKAKLVDVIEAFPDVFEVERRAEQKRCCLESPVVQFRSFGHLDP